MSITIKKSVSGSIKSRWPKPRVVKWLEIGAVPALLGLWLPDWVGGYHDLFNGIGKWYSLPPLLTYIGAVILLVACGIPLPWSSHFRCVSSCVRRHKRRNSFINFSCPSGIAGGNDWFFNTCPVFWYSFFLVHNRKGC